MRRIATALCAAGMLLPAPATAGAFGPVGSFDGSGTGSGQFNHPQSAAATGATVYVADTANNRVPFYSPSGTFQDSLPSPPTAPQDVAADGTVTVAAGPSQVVRWIGSAALPFSSPGTSYGVAVDGSGTIYVSDTQNGVIHKFDMLGVQQGDIGGGQLVQPQGMTSDGSAIYVADPGNGRILKFDSSGSVLGIWAMPSYTIVANGQTFSGRIEPHDVAVDGSGRVFAPDVGAHSNLVAVFGAGGSLEQVFGSPDSDPGNPCSLRGPWGVAVAGSVLYVVSTGENRIRTFDDAATPCPAVNFGAGGGIHPGSADRSRPKVKLKGLPKGCARRNFTLRIQATDDIQLGRFILLVNHRRVANQAVNKQTWNLRVNFPVRKVRRQLPRGTAVRVLIEVRVSDTAGKKSRVRRSFRICGAG